MLRDRVMLTICSLSSSVSRWKMGLTTKLKALHTMWRICSKLLLPSGTASLLVSEGSLPIESYMIHCGSGKTTLIVQIHLLKFLSDQELTESQLERVSTNSLITTRMLHRLFKQRILL